MAKFKDGDKFVFNNCKTNRAIKEGIYSDIEIGKVYTLYNKDGGLWFDDSGYDTREFSAFVDKENGPGYKVTKIK
jgi:hypothetical protein